MVYGSSAGQAAPIRAGIGGRLLTVVRNGREWPPQDPNITLTCESATSPNEPCYLAGKKLYFNLYTATYIVSHSHLFFYCSTILSGPT